MAFQSLPDSLENIAKSAYMDTSTKEIKEAGIRYNTKILQELISRFDKKNWINEEIFFNYYRMVKEKNFPLLSDGHPGYEASQYWAKIMKDHL